VEQGLCNGWASIWPRPFAYLSHCSTAAAAYSRFGACTPHLGHIDRQWWVPVTTNNGATAWHSAANAVSVILTAELMRLNTDFHSRRFRVFHPGATDTVRAKQHQNMDTFGQVLVQFMMVWQRYIDHSSLNCARRSARKSSRESMIHLLSQQSLHLSTQVHSAIIWQHLHKSFNHFCLSP